MISTGQSLSCIVPPDALADAYRRALDKHSIISISDTRGNISYVNDLFCHVMGYERAELVGQTYKLLSSGVHGPQFIEKLWETADSGETWVGEVCNRTKEGVLIWFDNIVIPLLDDRQVVTAHLSVRKDITKRKQAEEKLQHSERFLANVAEVARIGGWSLEVATNTIFWSEQTRQIHELPAGYTPPIEEAINYYAPEARQTITHAVENTINTGESWDLELPMITAKGRHIWARSVGHLLENADQSPMLIGAFQDITERKHVEEALRKEVQQRHKAEQLLRDVLETIPDAVAAYDDEDRLMICNTSYLETYAASAEAMVPGARFEDIIRFGLMRGQYADAGTSQEEQQKWLDRRLKDHKNPPEQLNQKLRDGTWLQVREHRSPAGTTVGVRSDITAMKRAEEKLRRFAEEDPLTSLFNRSRFCLALDEILARQDERRGRAQKYGCVVLFDVDHFKPVNDACGHDIGDEVLVRIAERMRSILEQGDVGARLGGDEFVFVLADKENQQACDDVLRKLSDLMEQPIETNSGPLRLSLSVGAAPFTDGSINSRQLLKQADLAQYRAKEQGRAQWCWFSEDDRANLQRDTELGEALNECLGNSDGMDCRFAPVAGAHDGAPIGFRAELSWAHEGGIVTASALQLLAQKSGQSARLSIHKLTQALKVIGTHEARGISFGDVWITVNADCLKIGHFADRLQELCDAYGVAPGQLTIAVDEHVLGQRSASAVEAALADIKATGIAVALDRFGAAASSLSKLKAMGIDKVRLSSDVTDPLVDPHACDAIASGLISIARTFDIKVYAANAQTPAHAARLAILGCDALQGAVIGKPMLGDAVADYLGAMALRTLEGMSTDMRNSSSTESKKTSGDAA